MPPDDNAPVTRAECMLRHENVGQRFQSLERDMVEMKRDMADVKVMLAKMTDNQGLLLKVIVLILVLVLAFGGVDVSALLGGV